MSHDVDECYDVYSERVTRARKTHTCDACDRDINPGQLYMRVSWVFDGSANQVKRCGACQAIHLHLRELCSDRDMWPDETLGCGLDYQEEWGEPPPDSIARLPLLSSEEASSLLEVGP